MITSDEQFLQREMDRLAAHINWFTKEFGLATGKFLERQMGLLSRDLINVSWPKDRSKTAEKIENSIQSKFESVSWGNASSERWDAALSQAGGKHGTGDTYWYAWNSTGVYGVDKDVDLRDATPKALLYLANRMTANGKIRAGVRGKQTIYISRKILSKPKTVKEVVKMAQKHIGRLKAGWMVSWRALGSRGAQVPQWIARHENGARGFIINSSDTPGTPSITIANTARGVNKMKAKAGYIAKRALARRIRLLVADIKFAVKNPQKWREREAAAGFTYEEA